MEPTNRPTGPKPTLIRTLSDAPAVVLEDLARSGLTPKDMRIGFLDNGIRNIVGLGPYTHGYVIPYFGIRGGATSFYRVKVIQQGFLATPEQKYKQPARSNNHVYFPPGLFECVVKFSQEHNGQGILVITEGEKKAACAVKMGIPCVGLGGVDSWRSRTVELKASAEITRSRDKTTIKLPSGSKTMQETVVLADGFNDMLELIEEYRLTVILIFDSDYGGKVKAEVQRAITLLAYELRHLGVPSSRLRQIILPDLHTTAPVRNADDIVIEGPAVHKSGLDDYLMEVGPKVLLQQIMDSLHDPTKFPRHPNTKGYLNSQLNNLQDRKLAQQLAHIILAEIDADGIRFRDSFSGMPYFYDRTTYKLMPAAILNGRGQFMHETPFGTILYQRFGLGASDVKVLTWIASQYTGEEPITDVTPRRIRALITEASDPTNPYGIALQVSDSNFIAVSHDPKKPVKLHINGDLGLLFEQGQVEPLDVDTVLEAFEQINAEPGTLAPWWEEVLDDTNVGRSLEDLQAAFPGKNPDEVDASLIPVSAKGKRMRQLATLLYYISPYLQRWRGIQLPVEIMIGGPGSGKSSLYEMRLNIMSGRPYLRNLPNDIKDWQASLANSGGLHVTDNVHFTKGDMKQRISDEICRLTTEPVPTIEVRQLYTTATLVRFPVDITFGFTAVTQPFQNADLFSRATIFETCNLGKPPDSDWVRKKMDAYGGRELWVAHELVFLHRFLRQAAKPPEEGGWDDNFQTIHRLAHLEQALTIAARVLGINADFLRRSVKEIQHNASVDSDWTLQGIVAFVKAHETPGEDVQFTLDDVVSWAESGEYRGNPQLNNARKLGRYVKSHYSLVAATAGIRMGLTGPEGQQTYIISRTRTRAAVEQEQEQEQEQELEQDQGQDQV